MKTFLYIFGICGIILFSNKYYNFNSNKFTDELIELITVHYHHHKSVTQRSTFNAELGLITKYEIRFNNGTIIRYGENGKVVFAEAYDNDIIPMALLPKRIQKHLFKNHHGINVIKYNADYSKKEFTVVLENNLKIDFK